MRTSRRASRSRRFPHRKRIDELKGGRDNTLEVDEQELAAAKHLSYTADLDRLHACNVFIVTVPTPVDAANRPDLTPLVRASETVGKAMPNLEDYIANPQRQTLSLSSPRSTARPPS